VLERRASGSEPRADLDLPHIDKLEGTLKAIRDHTTGYRWDILIDAIDRQLYDEPLKSRDEIIKGNQALPISILQGLLDTLTALQR